MPPPSGSFTAWVGDEPLHAHAPLASHWKEGFIVKGKATHPSRAGRDYYTVRWYTGEIDFDISGNDLTYRGMAETFFLYVFVAPFFIIKNWVKSL